MSANQLSMPSKSLMDLVLTLINIKKPLLKNGNIFLKLVLQEKDTIYILDSSIFQAPIFVFLWNNAPYEKLRKFVNELYSTVKCLNPALIYLYRENTESTIEYLEKDRGVQALISLWERDKARPYYQDKPEGAEGFKQFLRDYAKISKLLFDSLKCNKLSIEISKADWTAYENKMLSFIEIENTPSPNFYPPDGVYRNDELDYEITVVGLMIIDPDGNKKKLIPKTAKEFYIEGLPMILHFENTDQIVMSGLQIHTRWSITGTRYNKVRK